MGQHTKDYVSRHTIECLPNPEIMRCLKRYCARLLPDQRITPRRGIDLTNGTVSMWVECTAGPSQRPALDELSQPAATAPGMISPAVYEHTD